MAIRKITVFTYLSNEAVAVLAGIFTHDDGLRLGTFAYGRRYIERDNVLPVDPVSLSLGSRANEVLSNGGIFGAFRDASPDYWGRMVIPPSSKRHRKPSPRLIISWPRMQHGLAFLTSGFHQRTRNQPCNLPTSINLPK